MECCLGWFFAGETHDDWFFLSFSINSLNVITRIASSGSGHSRNLHRGNVILWRGWSGRRAWWRLSIPLMMLWAWLWGWQRFEVMANLRRCYGGGGGLRHPTQDPFLTVVFLD
jgi:hypothetical protein